MRRFQSTGGGAVRFWQVQLERASVVTEWGELAAERHGRMRRKGYGSVQEARDAVEGLIRARLDQGWVEATPTPLGPAEVDLDVYASGEERVEFGSSEERPAEDDDTPVATIELHRAACRAGVEAWAQAASPVPVRLLAAVWVDPEWRAALLQVDAVAPDGEGRASGVLTEVEGDRFALLTDGGELRWLAADAVVFAEREEAHV